MARTPPPSPLEDLLVVAADTCWKAKRDKVVDDALVRALSAATGAPAWDVFSRIDSALVSPARDADVPLEVQTRFQTS